MAEDDDQAAHAANSALRQDSERLLKAVDELRAMEREKRRAISSRTFHELAERVEQKAREVFRLAGQEEDDGRLAASLTAADPTAEEESIDRTPTAARQGSPPDRA